jgi:hypothetical protein
MKLTPSRDPARPNEGDDDLRSVLHGWDTTVRYCVVTLVTAVPPVVIIWLTSRR